MSLWTRICIDRIGITVTIGSKEFYYYIKDVLDTWVIDHTPFPKGKVMRRNKKKYSIRYDYYSEYTYKKEGRRKILDITLGIYSIAPKAVQWYIKLTLYPSQFKGSEFDEFKSLFDAYFVSDQPSHLPP